MSSGSSPCLPSLRTRVSTRASIRRRFLPALLRPLTGSHKYIVSFDFFCGVAGRCRPHSPQSHRRSFYDCLGVQLDGVKRRAYNRGNLILKQQDQPDQHNQYIYKNSQVTEINGIPTQNTLCIKKKPPGFSSPGGTTRKIN